MVGNYQKQVIPKFESVKKNFQKRVTIRAFVFKCESIPNGENSIIGLQTLATRRRMLGLIMAYKNPSDRTHIGRSSLFTLRCSITKGRTGRLGIGTVRKNAGKFFLFNRVCSQFDELRKNIPFISSYEAMLDNYTLLN